MREVQLRHSIPQSICLLGFHLPAAAAPWFTSLPPIAAAVLTLCVLVSATVHFHAACAADRQGPVVVELRGESCRVRGGGKGVGPLTVKYPVYATQWLQILRFTPESGSPCRRTFILLPGAGSLDTRRALLKFARWRVEC